MSSAKPGPRTRYLWLMLFCLLVNPAPASVWDHTRLRLAASTALKYRVAAVFQPAFDAARLNWYLETHLDGAYLDDGFRPINVGLEAGFSLPRVKRLSLGVNLEQPLHTENYLLGVSATAHTRPFRSRFNFFFGAQWMRYIEPIKDIGGDADENVYNFLTGVSMKLGTP